MASSQDQLRRALEALGFSEHEAAVYAFLIQESPATGYRIAQGINKPVANTYKSLSSLQAKGAVVVDEGDGEARLCRAVPFDELSAQMERALRDRCRLAAEAVSRLEPARDDDGVYRLGTVEQVLGRARQMISRASQVVLASCFPEPLRGIRADLEAARGRGAGVLLKVYEPADATAVKGADVVMTNEPEFLREHFPAQELSLSVDAREHLVAVLDRDGRQVIHAVWSASPFLSFIHYGGLYAEWLLTRVTQQIHAGAGTAALKKALRRSFPEMKTPGYESLLGAFRPPPGGRPKPEKE